MPCFFVVLALVTPRLVVALLWFFTRWFDGLFATLLWPILGFHLPAHDLALVFSSSALVCGQWTPGLSE
jgi:hypothetical protein